MITPENLNDKIRDVFQRSACGQCLRWDHRNRFLVYDRTKASLDFLEILDFIENTHCRVNVPKKDPISGEQITTEFISESEWSKRTLGTVPVPEHGPEYYNEDYFKPSDKSCFDGEYTWARYEKSATMDAHVINTRFQPKRLLDVGAARGFLCKASLKLGIDAHGFDISQWAIDNCESEVRGRLRQFVIDGTTPWPYPNGCFDTIAALSVLEHVKPEHILFCLREMYRVTTKWAFIAVPLSTNTLNRPWGDPTHQCFMPMEWWIVQGYNAGFRYNWQKTSFDVDTDDRFTEPVVQVYIAFQKGGLDLAPSVGRY